MNGCKLTSFSIRLLLATLLLMSAFGSKLAFARQRRLTISHKRSTLFSCHIDRVFTFVPGTGGDSDQKFATSSRQNVDEEVRLTVDVKSRLLALIIQVEGGPTRTHILRDVEQGSSGGSGAGGRADTTIRGKDGGSVFTLFAAYDSNGFDHDAALQISGTDNLLLTCDSDPYTSPQVSGLGRFGSTNIYVLNADGLATKMDDLPVEPSPEEHP